MKLSQTKHKSSNPYLARVRRNFSFLKDTSHLDDLYAKAIRLKERDGYLLTFSKFHASDSSLLASILKQLKEQTSLIPKSKLGKTWLTREFLDKADQMLLLVCGAAGDLVGLMSLSAFIDRDRRYVELRILSKNSSAKTHAVMRDAVKSAIAWIEEILRPQEIFYLLKAKEKKSARFFEAIGFKGESLKSSKAAQVKMIYEQNPALCGRELILTGGPSISSREIFYSMDATRTGWNHSSSNYITRLQDYTASYLGVPYALATSSCTGALHLALAALGVGPGDEVIVPETTWVATANAAVYVGAKPVFVDVEMDTWCMDPKAFEKAITKRTKAAIPVHSYGHPARMDEIMRIANKHNLSIIEDAAPSFGAEFKGKKVGSFGDFAAFSFHGAKIAVSGEGGILAIANEALYKKVYPIWDQGRIPNTFWIEKRGLKYKMANVQAAIALGQMERLDDLVEAKREIFSWYEEGLRHLAGIKLNKELPWARSIYWAPSIYLTEQASVPPQELRTALKSKNVDTRPLFPAISQYPIWGQKYVPGPNADLLHRQAFHLPGGVCLKHSQVKYICRIIQETFAKKKSR